MSAYREPAQLITVVRNPRDAEAAGRGDWKVRTWWHVAWLAWQAGAQRGPDWRAKALDDGALARDRLLVELLDYLERTEGIVLDVLKHENVFALSRAVRTSSILDALLRRAGELSNYDVDGLPGYEPSTAEHSQYFSLEGAWAEALEGYAELHVGPADAWSNDRLDEPAIGAGFTFPGTASDKLLASSLGDRRANLASQGISVSHVDDYVGVYRTMYMAELVSRGPTLDRQARALTGWFDESIGIIKAADPHLEVAQPRARTRKS